MEYGLWRACPSASVAAYGIEGQMVGATFVPTPGDQSFRGNPDDLRAFLKDWYGWVWEPVQEAITALALEDKFHGGDEDYTVYEDESNTTKVVVCQQGRPGVLYLIAYKM